jgi:HAMP domain-containing protein
MSAGTPIPPNRAYPNVPPPPATSGNTVLKVVLIVVGVLFLLAVIISGVIGIGIYRLAKSAHKDSSGNVSLSTPGGTITAGQNATFTAADLGVDLYPGATTSEGSMNMQTPNGSMVTAVYLSSDPVDKIVAFYKEKLGDQASIIQTGNGTVLSAGDKDKNNVVITITTEGASSKIAIVHVTNTKSRS